MTDPEHQMKIVVAKRSIEAVIKSRQIEATIAVRRVEVVEFIGANAS